MAYASKCVVTMQKILSSYFTAWPYLWRRFERHCGVDVKVKE